MRHLKFTTQIIAAILICNFVHGQTQISPKYSVDGGVNALATYGDTLIVGGNFSSVGIYTGCGALLNNGSDQPNLTFPKVIGEIYSSSPDGNGGFYIFGGYRRESEGSNASSVRIEHVLPNFQFETGFSLLVDVLFPRQSKIFFYNGILYFGGQNVNQIGGNTTGNLAGINVVTKQLVTWLPAVGTNNISCLAASQNKLYVSGSFSTIGGQNRTGIAAIEIGTGIIKPWNPVLNGGVSDIKFYNNKVILGGGFGDGQGPCCTYHGCAVFDTITGSSPQYIIRSAGLFGNGMNYLYWAAGISQLALKGDTLYTFSGGTFDTRVTAISLSNNHVIWAKYFNMIASGSKMEIADSFLYVSGRSFSEIYNTNATNDNVADIERKIKGIVKLNANTGSLVNWFADPVAGPDVNTISLAGNNVFIGGSFNYINGFDRPGIAMLKNSTQEVLPFQVNIVYTNINALKVIGNTIYAAGNINYLNGVNQARSVIAFNINTGALLPWNPANLGSVSAMEVNNNYVFVGGSLSEPAGGLNRQNLFAIDRQTGALANWSPNPNNYISANSLHISKNRLYVGGRFTTISGQSRTNIASYDTSTLALTNWNPNLNTFSYVTSISSSDTSIWIGANGTIGTGQSQTHLYAGLNPQTGTITDAPIANLPYSGQVNSLLVKGKYLIAGGSFTINNSPCNNIAMYDLANKSLVSNGSFCQAFTNGGGINAMAAIGDDLYIGGNFATLNGKVNATYLERLKYPLGFFGAPADSSYTYFPKSGGNGGDVTVNLYSYQIISGMKFKLVAAGLPDIVVPDSLITFPQNYRMQVGLDLRGKLVGDYDVVLTKGQSQVIFTKGFKIEQFIKPIIASDIAGGNVIRVGRPELFNITLTNTGNADARAIPVWIITSNNLDFDLQVPFQNNSGIILDSSVYTNIDSLDGVPFSGKVRMLLIYQIMEKEVYSLPLIVKSSGGQFLIRVLTGTPLMQSPIDRRAIADCLGTLVYEAAKYIVDKKASQLTNCSIGIVDAVTETIDRAIKKGNQTGLKRVTNLTWPSAEWAINCLQSAGTFVPIFGEYKLAQEVADALWDLHKGYKAGTAVYEECSKLLPDDKNGKDKNGNSVISRDPNDKIGIGVGSKNYISNKEILQYGIRFENIASATADAQVVRIVDTLDKTKLNLSTFQLNSYNFGKRYISFSPGQKTNTEYTDLRPQKNLILRTKVNLDTITGIFSAEFTSLDPNTLQLTANALLGFLPPNVNAPEGEGGIYFTVEVKSELPNKSVFNNKAYIYFDANPAIATPVWSNTLDKVAPRSSMTDLPNFTSDTTFKISWRGEDDESGIESYNIYYTVNGATPQPFLLKTKLNTIDFTGKYDSTYSFYSVAIDTAGNYEQKTTFDTKTTITSDEVRIYPNPSFGRFTAEVKAGMNIVDLKLYNLQGQLIPMKYTSSGNKFLITIQGIFSNGMYLLKVQTDKKVIGKKLLIER